MHIKTKQKTQSPFKSVLKVDKHEKVFFAKSGNLNWTNEFICGHFWSGR